MTSAPANACSCPACQSACTYKPGWFLPGQVEVLSENLNLTVEELFKTRLAVDYLTSEQGEDEVFVLSPVVVGNEAGEIFPFNPLGRCTFYQDDGSCEIHHLGKPAECASLLHDGTKLDHHEVGRAWRGHQGQVRALLGRPLEEPDPDVEDVVNLLLEVTR